MLQTEAVALGCHSDVGADCVAACLSLLPVGRNSMVAEYHLVRCASWQPSQIVFQYVYNTGFIFTCICRSRAAYPFCS